MCNQKICYNVYCAGRPCCVFLYWRRWRCWRCLVRWSGKDHAQSSRPCPSLTWTRWMTGDVMFNQINDLTLLLRNKNSDEKLKIITLFWGWKKPNNYLNRKKCNNRDFPFNPFWKSLLLRLLCSTWARGTSKSIRGAGLDLNSSAASNTSILRSRVRSESTALPTVQCEFKPSLLYVFLINYVEKFM